MTYYNEDQQVEAIQRWWKKYGVSVIFGVILGLAIMYGWQMWQRHQGQKIAQASAAYQSILNNMILQDDKQATRQAQQLVQDMPNTVYATVARLALAKLAVNQQKYSDAISQLQWVADHGKLSAYQQVAKIELARIYAEQKQWDAALAQLTVVKDAAYLSSINEVKGDVLMAQGKSQQAQQAYEMALKSSAKDAPIRATLLMKLNSVSQNVAPGGVA